MANLKEVTADGDVSAGPAFLHSVALTAGADAATLVVKDGGAGGTARLTLKAATGTTIVWAAQSDQGAQFHTSVYADLTGTGPVADLEYS